MKVRNLFRSIVGVCAIGATVAGPGFAQAAAPAVIADVAQVTVAHRTTFTIVVENHGSGIGSIDLRADLPEGSTLVDSFAGYPNENPGANLGDAVGWINLEVPNDRPWGPFVFTIDSDQPMVCTHVNMWYSTGDQSGVYNSPELCNDKPVTMTPDFGKGIFSH